MYYNPHLAHQVQHAEAFKRSGFQVTHALNQPASDVCVISGPHYAYNVMKHHPRTLMIDRAWYGDPEYVSIGWLQEDGTRRFATGDAPRPKPDFEPWGRRECSCLILADYNQDVSGIVFDASSRFQHVEVRQHPANVQGIQVDLKSAIRLRDVVICSKGTAGFEAIIQGVPVICLDPLSELAPVCAASIDAELYRGPRADWLHDMSYKQWAIAEIGSGEAWQHLKDVK